MVCHVDQVLESGSEHGMHMRGLTAIASLMISIIEMYSTCFDKEVDLAVSWRPASRKPELRHEV
jgi:uncharacterized Ntn-hydrolase superfamily protein